MNEFCVVNIITKANNKYSLIHETCNSFRFSQMSSSYMPRVSTYFFFLKNEQFCQLNKIVFFFKNVI